MVKKEIIPPKGELKSNDIVIYFDNICDENGKKLIRSEKRSRIRELMYDLFSKDDENKCTLEDGSEVPIVVERREYHRPAFCCLNTVEAPKDEILKAFANKINCSLKQEKYPPKENGELIVNDAKYFLDDVMVGGKKVTSIKKLQALKAMFSELYENKAENVCKLENGEEIPIIVKRVSDNNILACCLNTSQHRKEVLKAFAQKTGCKYLEHKENDFRPEDKKVGELTARDCSRFLYSVQDLIPQAPKDDGSSKLVEWFNAIYENPDVNQVILPDGSKQPLVVYRTSHSQRCVCLNTSDEVVKPFVIKRIAEITKSDINLDNVPIESHGAQDLVTLIKTLDETSKRSSSPKERAYYDSYKQKAYLALAPSSKELTVKAWLKNNFEK